MANSPLIGQQPDIELGRAIEVPAELAGLPVEPGVTEAILADAGEQPGALPLVSTALLALWGVSWRCWPRSPTGDCPSRTA